MKNSYSQIIQTLASVNSFGFILTIVCLLYLGECSTASREAVRRGRLFSLIIRKVDSERLRSLPIVTQ